MWTQLFSFRCRRVWFHLNGFGAIMGASRPQRVTKSHPGEAAFTGWCLWPPEQKCWGVVWLVVTPPSLQFPVPFAHQQVDQTIISWPLASSTLLTWVLQTRWRHGRGTSVCPWSWSLRWPGHTHPAAALRSHWSGRGRKDSAPQSPSRRPLP